VIISAAGVRHFWSRPVAGSVGPPTHRHGQWNRGRTRAARARSQYRRCRRCRCTEVLSADRNDLISLHSRGGAAGTRNGRGCFGSRVHRHFRAEWHARFNLPGGPLRAFLFFSSCSAGRRGAARSSPPGINQRRICRPACESHQHNSNRGRYSRCRHSPGSSAFCRSSAPA
jgi:hypothetical protein